MGQSGPLRRMTRSQAGTPSAHADETHHRSTHTDEELVECKIFAPSTVASARASTIASGGVQNYCTFDGCVCKSFHDCICGVQSTKVGIYIVAGAFIGGAFRA